MLMPNILIAQLVDKPSILKVDWKVTLVKIQMTTGQWMIRPNVTCVVDL